MLWALLGDVESLFKLLSLVGFAKMECGQHSPATAQSPDTAAKAMQEPKPGPSTQGGSAPAPSRPGSTLLWGAPAPTGVPVGWRYPSEAAPSPSHPSQQGDCSSLLSSYTFSSWLRPSPLRPKESPVCICGHFSAHNAEINPPLCVWSFWESIMCKNREIRKYL